MSIFRITDRYDLEIECLTTLVDFRHSFGRREMNNNGEMSFCIENQCLILQFVNALVTIPIGLKSFLGFKF
jgi:hypothetical protein